MAWQDRPYYRDRGSEWNPLWSILNGSVPLFTAFGIRVRAHASLIILAVLVLIFGLGQGFKIEDRVKSMAVLFVIVLLHEFGHCFAARWVGGSADDILMTPIGGLAFASPPRRPLPTFITVAGGPAVNVLICLLCGVILWVFFGSLPWKPFGLSAPGDRFQGGWFNVWSYTFWIYKISWMLLIFNLLPIFPLDGGQLLQSILWPKFGYYRSMLFACVTGMVGAVLLGMAGLASGSIWLVFIAISGFMTCMSQRYALKASGPFEAYDEVDYSASLRNPDLRKTRRRTGRRKVAKAARHVREDAAEQTKIDAILAKVSAHGMNSLSWLEKRALRKATERQKQRDLELSRSRY